MRLRDYLFSLTLATLLPLAIFAGIVGSLLVHEQRETFRHGAEERTRALLTAVDAELRGSADTVVALGKSESLAEGDLVQFRRTAQRVLASQPGWVNINLALPDGQRVVDLVAPEGAPLPPIQRFEASLELALQKRKPVIGALAIGPVTKRWVFTVRAPVLQDDDRVKYVLTAVVDPKTLASLVAMQDLPSSWVAVVLDENHRIVAGTPEADKTRGQLASQSLRDALVGTARGWIFARTLEGTDVYTAYYRSPMSGWSFAMSIPATEVNAGAWRAAGLLALALLGAVVLAFALARNVGRRMSAPITSLVSAADAIGRGEPVRVPQTASIAEIRRLAIALQESTDSLRDRQERLQLALHAGRMGNWDWDLRTNKVAWSEDLEAIHGLAPGTFPGTFEAYQKDIHPDDRDYVQQAIACSLEQGNHHIEYRIVLPNGDTRWVEGRGRVYRDESGVPLRVIGVCTDITGRKRAEEALKEADRRKDEFLATLAHELRNPLAPLCNALELLRRTSDNKAMVEQARAMMDRQVSQIVRLVDDLLDVSRITGGRLQLRKERVDLADVLSAALETTRPLIEARAHELDVMLPMEAMPLNADPTRLSQMFANLLNNAAKYTERAGHIRLTVERQANEAVVRVRDTGIGLPHEHLSDIFNMFSQLAPALERSQGGLGIGLSLVKGLVSLHGGSIEARSDGPGKGSEFIVRLPMATEKIIEEAVPPSRQGEQVEVAKFRLLIVDDLKDSADSLAALLKMIGHKVHTAYDGEDAVIAAETFRPDVVLLDIGMSRMNGYDACRRIREQPWGMGMYLIALTGWGQETDRHRSKQAGFDHHLVKPVDQDELMKVLASLPARLGGVRDFRLSNGP